jgi:hypothetical protein
MPFILRGPSFQIFKQKSRLKQGVLSGFEQENQCKSAQSVVKKITESKTCPFQSIAHCFQF